MKNFKIKTWNRLIFILFTMASHHLLGQTINVTTVSPLQNSIAQTIHPIVSCTFNSPLDTSTINRISFSVVGENSGYKIGTFSFIDSLKTVMFTSFANFLAGEKVSVRLSHQIRSDNGDSLTSGFFWTFRIPITHPTRPFFREPISYGGGGYGMQCIDMNDDGYIDIVTSSGVIRLNNGSGQFIQSLYIPDVDGFYDIIVDDFNRDGKMDVVYTGSDGLKIGLGDGYGNFALQTKPFWFYRYLSADLNADGYPDIVGINKVPASNPPYDDTLSFWGIALNNGNGQFTDTSRAGVLSGWFSNLTQSDIDNDGDIDILIISKRVVTPGPVLIGLDGLAVYKNDGQSVFDAVNIYPSYSTPWFDIGFPAFIYTSDFNNDRLNDVAIVGDFAGIISLNLGNGILGTDSLFTRRFHGAEIVAPFICGDFNGDNWIDVAVSGYSFPFDTSTATYFSSVINCNSMFYGCDVNGNPFKDTLGNNIDIYSLQSTDVDNDGDLDLIHCGNGIYVSINYDSAVAIHDVYIKPNNFIIYPNYPNPFNSETSFIYQLGQRQKVAIRVFDVLGKVVRILENGIMSIGKHYLQWEGRDDHGNILPSGVYLIHFEAEQSSRILKTIILK
jgi:hypothetical protein